MKLQPVFAPNVYRKRSEAVGINKALPLATYEDKQQGKVTPLHKYHSHMAFFE